MVDVVDSKTPSKDSPLYWERAYKALEEEMQK